MGLLHQIQGMGIGKSSPGVMGIRSRGTLVGEMATLTCRIVVLVCLFTLFCMQGVDFRVVSKGILAMGGGGVEGEAMPNEDSLSCLAKDVNGACDALGEHAVSCTHVLTS